MDLIFSVHTMNGADGPARIEFNITREQHKSHNERVAETRKGASMEAASVGDHR